MKELLYIPNGSYIKIKINGELRSFGEYIKSRKVSIDMTLSRIINGWFVAGFYERNNLPDSEYLTIEQFEIVEVEDK